MLSISTSNIARPEELGSNADKYLLQTKCKEEPEVQNSPQFRLTIILGLLRQLEKPLLVINRIQNSSKLDGSRASNLESIISLIFPAICKQTHFTTQSQRQLLSTSLLLTPASPKPDTHIAKARANEAPMAAPPPYPYTPLPAQCIRVLDLHPGPSDAPLQCDVVVQRVDGQPYDALSYVWGDPVSRLLMLV
jgi:hypothetical protein